MQLLGAIRAEGQLAEALISRYGSDVLVSCAPRQ